MSLPPPPEPDLETDQDEDDPDERRTPLPGELTVAWTAVFCCGWFAVMCGFAAVWTSSRTTGFPTWWLGPDAEPRLLLVTLLPFAAPLALVIEGLVHRRFLPFWGAVGALACAVVAGLDLADQPRYAVVEFVLAAGGLAVSAASYAGMLRRTG